jgi:hypothetical protein
VGQGQGDVGDSLGKGDPNADGPGKAGDQAGEHALEVELSLEELAQIMGEELQLPRIEPKGKQRIIAQKDKYVGIRRAGPESLRHFKRTFRQALRRQIMTGTYDPERPDDRAGARGSPLSLVAHDADAAVERGDDLHHGRVRLDGRRAEGDRAHRILLDRRLAAQPVQGASESRYIIHDAVAKEVDRDTFFRTRESGGTMISSAYKLCAKMIDDEFPAVEWNIYPFHFSDGDNWSVDDTVQCVELLKTQILPKVNLFCYGQVESPYGSGQFIKDLNENFDEDDSLVVSEIKGRKRSWSRSATSWARVNRPHGHASRLPRRHAARDRALRARVRPRLLGRRVRDPRLQADAGGRGLRRLPGALPPLALRHGVRAPGEEPHLRLLEDLRDGHQQQPRVRVSAGRELLGRSEDGHGATCSGTSTSSRTTTSSRRPTAG